MAKKPQAELTVEDIYADEKKRLRNLENMSQLILQKSAVRSDKNDPNSTIVSIDMEPSQLRSFIQLSDDLMKLRRKIYGLMDW